MRKTHSRLLGSVKTFLAAVMALPLLTSCLGDGEDTWGVSYGTTDYIYANSGTVYLLFSISSDWELYKTETNSWITFGATSGSGPFYGYVSVTVDKNETGSVRYCVYKVTSTDDNSFSGSISQMATRGDGSLGSSPLVSKITGSDGSEVEILYNSTYDIPSSITMTKNGEELAEYSFVYNTADTTLYVMSGSDIALSGTYNSAWNPTGELTSPSGDETIDWSYNATYLSNATTMTVEYTGDDGTTDTRIFYISTISDCDDQIIHRKLECDAYYASDDEEFETGSMSVTLGSDADYEDYVSNQNQNVDVNQLIFGIERCNPLMLLGFYRWTRCGYIYESVEGDDGDYTFSPELNSDGSVESLAIENPNGKTITYTFEY